jgi:hypothetical protein
LVNAESSEPAGIIIHARQKGWRGGWLCVRVKPSAKVRGMTDCGELCWFG